MSTLAPRRGLYFGQRSVPESTAPKCTETERILGLKTTFLDQVRRLGELVCSTSDVEFDSDDGGVASGVYIESWLYNPSEPSNHLLTHLTVKRKTGEGKLYFTPSAKTCAVTLPVTTVGNMADFRGKIVPFLFRLYQSNRVGNSEENHLIISDVILAPTDGEQYGSVAMFPDSCRGLLYGIQVHMRYKGNTRLAVGSHPVVPLLVLDHIILDIDCLFRSPTPPVWPVFYSAALAKTEGTTETADLAAKLEAVYKEIDNSRLIASSSMCAEKLVCHQPYVSEGIDAALAKPIRTPERPERTETEQRPRESSCTIS